MLVGVSHHRHGRVTLLNVPLKAPEIAGLAILSALLPGDTFGIILLGVVLDAKGESGTAE